MTSWQVSTWFLFTFGQENIENIDNSKEFLEMG